MDERIALVFSWDPRAHAWVKERGPEEAVPPPAAPRDFGAVQTYFLDVSTGRWVPTILGVRARVIAHELGEYYRAPRAAGLDIAEAAAKRSAVETYERSAGRPLAFVFVAIVVALLVIGLGASQTLFASQLGLPSLTSPAPTAVVPEATAPAGQPAASAQPTASAAAAPTQTTTAVAPATLVTPRPATQAPQQQTAPPVQPAIITLSVTTTDGSKLTYNGNNIVNAGSVVNVSISAVQADGSIFRNQLEVRIGPNGAWSPMTRNAQGQYVASVPVTAPKGAEPLQVLVHVGAGATAYGLGNLFVN